VANRSVALVASDLLLLLADFANEISNFFPYLIPKIILGLKWSLQQALPMKNSGWTSGKPVETEKRLLISLMLTLGEWCMRLPIESLVSSHDQDKSSLLTCIFEVMFLFIMKYYYNLRVQNYYCWQYCNHYSILFPVWFGWPTIGSLYGISWVPIPRRIAHY